MPINPDRPPDYGKGSDPLAREFRSFRNGDFVRDPMGGGRVIFRKGGDGFMPPTPPPKNPKGGRFGLPDIPPPRGAGRVGATVGIVVGGGALGLAIGKKIYEDASNPNSPVVKLSDYFQGIGKGKKKGAKLTTTGGQEPQKGTLPFTGGQGAFWYIVRFRGEAQTKLNGTKGSSQFEASIRVFGGIESIKFQTVPGQYDTDAWGYAINSGENYERIQWDGNAISGQLGYYFPIQAREPTEEEWNHPYNTGAWMKNPPNILVYREDGTDGQTDREDNGDPPTVPPTLKIPITILLDDSIFDGNGYNPPPTLKIHGVTLRGWIFGDGNASPSPQTIPVPVPSPKPPEPPPVPPVITPNVLGTGRSVRQGVATTPKVSNEKGQKPNANEPATIILPSVRNASGNQVIAGQGEIVLKQGQQSPPQTRSQTDIQKLLEQAGSTITTTITNPLVAPVVGLGSAPITPVQPNGKVTTPDPVPKENKTGVDPVVQSGGGCCVPTMGKLNAIDNKLGQLAPDLAELGLLQVINNKLGDQVPGGLSGWLGKFARSIWLDKAINFMTLFFTIHNAYSLSRNVVQSAEELLTTVIQFIGTKMKDETLQDFDVSEAIGAELQETLQAILGKEQTKEFNEKMTKLNRILTSASNVLSSVESMFFSVTSILNMVGQNTGKIGNALLRSGTVLEDSYNKMQERYSMFFGSRFKFFDNYNQSVANSGEIIENLSSVAGEAISIDEQKDEIKTNFTEFKKAITDLKPQENLAATKVVKADEGKKLDSKSPEVIPSSDNNNAEE